MPAKRSPRGHFHSTIARRARPGPGRPPVHHESWSKVSVVLFDRQIVELEHLLTDIRRKSRKTINRASLIRALIDALFASGIDLSGATSEADLRRA